MTALGHARRFYHVWATSGQQLDYVEMFLQCA
jgi:hypothetical protein